MILQYAANETAREISQYSYVLTKTGIVEKRNSTASRAAAFEGRVSKLMTDIESVGRTLSTGEGLAELPENVQQAGEHAQNIVGDPDALMEDIFSFVKTKGADMLSNLVIEELVKGVVKEQIENMSSKSADEYLEDLGIDGGLSGLDFSGSRWANKASAGMPELEVSVAYTIDFHLGILELEPKRFKVCAKTALW